MDCYFLAQPSDLSDPSEWCSQVLWNTEFPLDEIQAMPNLCYCSHFALVKGTLSCEGRACPVDSGVIKSRSFKIRKQATYQDTEVNFKDKSWYSEICRKVLSDCILGNHESFKHEDDQILPLRYLEQLLLTRRHAL